MKFRTLAIIALLLAFAAPAAAQEPISESTITVGERSVWRKLARGAARVVTLGIVQAADAIKQGETFVLTADHDGVDTHSYQVLVNTQLRETQPVGSLANGVIAFQFLGGLPKGTYSLVVKAIGDGGEGVSAPLGLSVTAGNPAAPGQLKIIKGGQ